jgi:Fatty acid desaturase
MLIATDVLRYTDDPRMSMRVLPRALQMPLTFLTGRTFSGQRELRLSATAHLLAAFISMAGGIELGASALGVGGWWLAIVPIGWAVTLHGMRNLRMMIYHQCAHRNMWRARDADNLLGKLCASLLLVQNFQRYSREHVSDHHARHHMTLRDPTVQAFLVALDLHPGMSTRSMWRCVLGKLVSPVFHARFAIARIRSFLHDADTTEKALAAGLYSLAAVAAALTAGWTTLLVTWFFPLFPLFQMSNTLRLCVKHTFPDATGTRRSGKDYFANLTNAIFLGEVAPGPFTPRRMRAWARWTVRMLAVHFPARYLVLTGDTVVHDYHHRHPRSPDWPNYLFARQRDIDAGHPGWPAYREVWGLVSAIDLVFRSLSVADPDVYDVAKIRSVSSRELFAAFDD